MSPTFNKQSARVMKLLSLLFETLWNSNFDVRSLNWMCLYCLNMFLHDTRRHDHKCSYIAPPLNIKLHNACLPPHANT